MKLFFTALTLAALSVTSLAHAAETGKPAPSFSATDINGQVVSLDALQGKTVVLEWFNYGCPFVRKHYKDGDMQALQKKWSEKGVVWVTVNSTEASHSDYKDVEATKKLAATINLASAHMLLDTSGEIGKAYSAKTTPHIFIINPAGELVYQGAIDDNSDADADPKEAKNYLDVALTSVSTGTAVAESETKAYGCGIKYAK